ncbi:MAG: hypothetical protein E6Q24_14930 [Chitinophagaceae bacterium]|nr:MAG: hypothetical protein E6Q24_14930 [Chitinophagaceae bacterium]
MMKIIFISFLLIALILASCNQSLKLSQEDFDWMPYKGNETLVFRTNSKESDTLFIQKKDTMIAYPEAQAINGKQCEEVAVFSKSSGGDDRGSGRSFYLFKVQKAKDGQTNLSFDLSIKGATFYRLLPVNADSLSKVKPSLVKTISQQFDDVYVIYPDDLSKDFSDRSNFVTKLYWSKSKGLIRFDKKDSTYWELEKKILDIV